MAYSIFWRFLPFAFDSPICVSRAYRNRTANKTVQFRPHSIMPKADSPTGFKPLKDTKLFTPFKLGSLNLEHRIVQAPLTRMRCTKESDGVNVPNDMVVEYYSQRANKGGLQLTEATDIHQYVRRTMKTKIIKPTCANQTHRPVATPASQESSPHRKSQAGRKLPTRFTQRAATSSSRCGTLVAHHQNLSAAVSSPGARATSPWTATTLTELPAPRTRRDP
jgi:hypothetical protein